MPESVQIPIEADSGAIDRIVRGLAAVKTEGEKTSKVLRDAFASEVLAQGIRTVGRELGGTAGRVAEAEAAIVSGFGSGGLAGAAMAGFTSVLAVGIETWRVWKEEARAAADASASTINQSVERVRQTRIAIASEQDRAAVLALQRTKGLSEAEAQLEIDRGRAAAKAIELQEKLAQQERSHQLALVDGAFEAAARIKLMGDGVRQEQVENAAQQDKIDARAATLAEQRALDTEKKAKDAAEAKRKAEIDAAEAAAKRLRELASAEAKRIADLQNEALWRGISDRLEAEERFQREKSDIEGRQEQRRDAREREKREKEKESALHFERFKDEARIASAEEAAERKLEIRRRENEELARLDAEAFAIEVDMQNERVRMAQLVLGATESLIDTVMSLGDAEKNVTKAQLEEEAKRAGIKAIMATAEAALNMALIPPNIPGAVSAGFAAAQFALVAGGKAIAASSAPSGGKKDPDSGSGSSSFGSGSRSRGRGGGSGEAPTIIVNMGGVLASRDEVIRDLREAQARYDRRR